MFLKRHKMSLTMLSSLVMIMLLFWGGTTVLADDGVIVRFVPTSSGPSCSGLSVGANLYSFAGSVVAPVTVTATTSLVSGPPGVVGFFGSLTWFPGNYSNTGITGNLGSSVAVPAPWTIVVQVESFNGGILTGRSRATITCSGGVISQTDVTFDPLDSQSSAAVFSGPGLPSTRNLVLVANESPIVEVPGGKPVGLSAKACQTVFIVSEDGGYGQVFVMGGWISLDDTVDVAEDYGQPGGQAVLPECLGK